MSQSATLLGMREVVKRFGGLPALAGVSLEVREGDILGLIGPNGSGKSTLINVVSGYHRADQGEIWFRGCNIARLEPHRIAELGLIRTHQIPRPFARMTVRQNVLVACLFGSRETRHRSPQDEAMHWLSFTGLADVADAPVASLTLHQRKFLELARAMACRPRLLFIDEVLAGLNPAELEEGIQLIRRIRDMGVTLVIVEHIMRAVVSLCNRLIVLNFGQKIAEGEPKDVLRTPEVVAAYLGREYA